MKKVLLICISIILLVSGCGSSSKEDVLKDFEDNVTKSNSYKLSGKMEIMSNDDKFTYSLETSYLKDNFFKVILVNETTGQEQVILRNNEGVYVVTPSLNKSFKFDSVWPDNSSQAYILSSILKDLQDDDKYELIEDESGYILKSVVNYPNNSNLKYQMIYLDKDIIPTSVEIYDENDNIAIKVSLSKVDLNAGLKEEDFALENYINKDDCSDSCEEGDETCLSACEEEKTGSLDNIIYPMYLPENTTLTSSEEVMNETSERVILTFGGDKNFVLVEEASSASSEFETIPITGNPLLLNDTVGALSTNSMYFTRNNIDYYIVSNDLTTDEMTSVALSLGKEESVMNAK